jgi:formylglycine-generating enzyme required for sulfatase activity
MKNALPPVSFLQALPGLDAPFEMNFVEGGKFDMGSSDEDAFDGEKPVHRVRLSAFFIGKFPA